MPRISKESVKAVIDERDMVALVVLFDADAHRTLRYLSRLTLDPDQPHHAAAVDAFRVLSRERSGQDEQIFLEAIRRRIWAMNEEGGNNDCSAPEVACAVIAGNAAAFGHFFSYVYHAACDELHFQAGLVRGYRLLAAWEPALVEPFREDMEALAARIEA